MVLFINTDGGVLDNKLDPPGLASSAYVATNYLGNHMGSKSVTFDGTNNDAEYRGVLLALHDLREYPDAEMAIFRSDSQLIVNQIAGVWKCRHPNMRAYLKEILQLISDSLITISFEWIPREENKAADWLCTHALYKGPKTNVWESMPAQVRRKTLTKEKQHEEVLRRSGVSGSSRRPHVSQCAS
jgi:probable phosphoglycerate mutase